MHKTPSPESLSTLSNHALSLLPCPANVLDGDMSDKVLCSVSKRGYICGLPRVVVVVVPVQRSARTDDRRFDITHGFAKIAPRLPADEM